MPKKSLKTRSKSTRGHKPLKRKTTGTSPRNAATATTHRKPLFRKAAGTAARQRKSIPDLTGNTEGQERFDDFGDLNEQARSAPGSSRALSTREVRNFGGAADVALRIMDDIAPVPNGSEVARTRDIAYYLGLITPDQEARGFIVEIFRLIEIKRDLAMQIIDGSTAPNLQLGKEFVRCSSQIQQLLSEFQLLNPDTKSLIYKVSQAITEIAREAGKNVGT